MTTTFKLLVLYPLLQLDQLDFQPPQFLFVDALAQTHRFLLFRPSPSFRFRVEPA